MSYSTNNNSKVWYGEESSYADDSTTPDSYFGIVESFNFNENNGIIDIKSISSRAVKNKAYGPYSITGSVNFKVIDWSMLKYVLGSVKDDGTYYNYPDTTTSFDVGILTLPSITIEAISDDSQGVRIFGNKCSSATINVAEGQVVTMNTSWTGQKPINITSPTGSYTSPTTVPLTYIQGEFKRSGSSVGVVSNVSINITNALNPIKGIHSRFIQDLKAGAFNVTMDTTIVMSTELAGTLIEDFYGQAASSGPVDGTGAVSDVSYTLTFTNGSKVDTITLTGTVESIGRAIDVGNSNRMLSVKYSLKNLTMAETK